MFIVMCCVCLFDLVFCVLLSIRLCCVVSLYCLDVFYVCLLCLLCLCVVLFC